MAESGKFILNSESEALEYLNRVLSGEEALDINNIEFGDWAKLKIRLTGDGFHSSINATVMKGLLALQDGIYQSYAIAKDVDSTRFLTYQERSNLEIEIEVSEGSSILGLDFQELGEKFIASTVDKMPPEYILATLITFALSWAGKASWAVFVKARSDEKIAELNAQARLDEQKASMLHQLEVMQESNKNALEHAKLNQENTKLLAQTIAMNPKLRDMSNAIDESKEAMVRAMANSGADTVEFQEIRLETNIAKELTTTPKSKWLPSRLDGTYLILSVDYSNSDVYKIKLQDVDTAVEVVAFFEDLTSNNSDIDLMTTAANLRSPVCVNMNVSRQGDKIKDAVIVNVTLPKVDAN